MLAAIEIDNLSKGYGAQFTLHIPNLIIVEGASVGFIGSNGAGKTTLLKLITDILLPATGEVLIRGKNVKASQDWKFFTSVYIDESYLMDYLTPREYIYFIAKLKGMRDEEIQSRTIEFSDVMSLDLLNEGKLIRDFSKGNIQKIGIASSLILSPQILILDEPFSNLDPSSRQSTIDALVRYGKQGNTILISGHDIDAIQRICSQVITLDKGQMVSEVTDEASAQGRLTNPFPFHHE